jgi:hypothetical protein
VAGGEGGGAEAKPLANGELFKLYFIHATSLSTVAQDVYIVQVESDPQLIPTYTTSLKLAAH